MKQVLLKWGLISVCLILLTPKSGVSQSTIDLPLTKLPRDLIHEAFIADIDGDGSRDLLYAAKIKSDSIIALLYRQTDSLVFTISDTIRNLASTHFFITDIDNSGQADLIMLERVGSTSVLTGMMNYDAVSKFVRMPLYEGDSVIDFSLDDFNNDGLKDLFLITSGAGNNPTFSIYLQHDNLSFETFRSAPGISKFLVTSLNGDGLKDLLLYNMDAQQVDFLTSVSYLKWDTLRLTANEVPFYWENIDINHDGRGDILFATNPSGPNISCYVNQSGTFSQQLLYQSPVSVRLLTPGDFTNDGLYDILVGTTDGNQIVKLNLQGDVAGISPLNVSGSTYAVTSSDLDDDGDLDEVGLLETVDSVFVHLLISNFPEPNHGPFSVQINSPVSVGDFTQFTWSRTADDHTPSPALSYDFYIRSDTEHRYVLTSDFNLLDTVRFGNRHVSRLGYNLFDSLCIFYRLSPGKYFWGVAGIDNAYYSETNIKDCTGGVCSNTAFVSQCLVLTRADTLVCINDNLHLQFGNSTDSVAWSSAKRGALGFGNSLNYPVSGADQIYAVAKPKFPCSDPSNACIKNYTLDVKTHPEIDFFGTEQASVCLNSVYRVVLELPDSLLSYTVFANDQPLDAMNPETVITEPTTITIMANTISCHSLTDTLLVNPVDVPVITISGNTQIYPGKSTFISASGASHYQWSPPQTLGSPGNASTTASPKETTTYTAEGWDTEDCSGTATIKIEVIPSIYIPDLFTPNNDGNNDRLIVYGRQISELNFSVYDGNGSRIFSSSSIPDMTVNGWDGTHNGVPVAPGTYVWVINGRFTNGAPLTYEGKNKGEVKILR